MRTVDLLQSNFDIWIRHYTSSLCTPHTCIKENDNHPDFDEHYITSYRLMIEMDYDEI